MSISKPAVQPRSEKPTKQELGKSLFGNEKFTKATRAGIARFFKTIEYSSTILRREEGLDSKPSDDKERLRELFGLIDPQKSGSLIMSASRWSMDRSGASVSKLQLRNPTSTEPVENRLDIKVRRHTEQSREDEITRLSYKGISADNVYFKGPGLSSTEVTVSLTEIDKDPNSSYVKVNRSLGVVLSIGGDSKLVDIRGVVVEHDITFTSDTLMVPDDDLVFDPQFIDMLEAFASQ